MLSTHKVEVVPVELLPHPNADSLSIVKVYGYQVVVRTEDWKDRKYGAYIPPDNIVDTSRPEFSFLGKHSRIRAKRLRGELSFGLLVPCDDRSIGDDVTEYLGVTHYEPELEGVKFPKADEDTAPNLYYSKYDIESGRRYHERVFTPGEPVAITEMIHGENTKYVYHEDRMYVGSRNRWVKEGPNQFWLALPDSVRDWCKKNPDYIVFGETYGQKELRYGHTDGKVSFRAFDILHNGTWIGWRNLPRDLPWVPLVDECRYDFDMVCAMAEGKSHIADHIREGVVVKPVVERYDAVIGRAILKWVGASYLEGSKGR